MKDLKKGVKILIQPIGGDKTWEQIATIESLKKEEYGELYSVEFQEEIIQGCYLLSEKTLLRMREEYCKKNQE